jgi:hypothetical protein
MPTKRKTPPPKPGDLFTDPRRFIRDCGLLRAGARAGWFDKAPQADRDALVARYSALLSEWHARPGRKAPREAVAVAQAALAMEIADDRRMDRTLRYSVAGGPTGQRTGRPRTRLRPSDFRSRLDAGEYRRRAAAGDFDPEQTPTLTTNTGESIELAWKRGRVAGLQLWFVCPKCRRRCVHLYPTPAGVRCRECVGIGYGAGGTPAT